MKDLIEEIDQFISDRTLRTFSNEDIERINHLAELCFIFRAEFDPMLLTSQRNTRNKANVSSLLDDKSANPVMRLMLSMLNSQCYEHADGHGMRNLQATLGLRHWMCEIYRVEREAEEPVP